MKIIVAGLPKTGTTSIYEALKQLGYTVHDLPESFIYLGNEWKEVAQKGGSKELFKRMYDNIDAACDAPFVNYWREIFEIYPDSKVILSIRDSEDQWYNSVKKQLETGLNFLVFSEYILKLIPTGRTSLVLFKLWAMSVLGKDGVVGYPRIKKIDEKVTKYIYKNHNRRVQNVVPKEQLLIYNPSQGWDPLCKFLGKETPRTSFPRKNIGASNLSDPTNMLIKQFIIEIAILFLVIFSFVYFCFYIFT